MLVEKDLFLCVLPVHSCTISRAGRVERRENCFHNSRRFNLPQLLPATHERELEIARTLRGRVGVLDGKHRLELHHDERAALGVHRYLRTRTARLATYVRRPPSRDEFAVIVLRKRRGQRSDVGNTGCRRRLHLHHRAVVGRCGRLRTPPRCARVERVRDGEQLCGAGLALEMLYQFAELHCCRIELEEEALADRWLYREALPRRSVYIIHHQHAVCNPGRLRRDTVAEQDRARAKVPRSRFDSRDNIIECPAPAGVLCEDEGNIGHAVATQVAGRLVAEVLRCDLCRRAESREHDRLPIHERYRLPVDDIGHVLVIRNALRWNGIIRTSPIPCSADDNECGHDEGDE